MSLYHEAADVLQAPSSSGGSLKARIFSNKALKSQPAQLYALVIESCKWSHVLKEVIENAGILSLEKKLTPILSLLLVHDLLLAKKGIALPSSHGLRTAVERHKARLQAELTKARIRRGKGSLEALKEAVEAGEAEAVGDDDSSASSAVPLHPRWVRINTLKTQLEDQLETTFAGYELVQSVEAAGRRGSKCLHIDQHIPNLVAISPDTDLTKTPAYLDGSIIIQDKASCFPAYLLDPLPQDGDIMDTCAAPGNKTTHLAAILRSHIHDPEDRSQTIHAFEKDKRRAETLEKMVTLAGAAPFIKIHAGQDFLKVNPDDPAYQNVTALLLDPSCSGSGIIGRDDMPTLHLPEITPQNNSASSSKSKSKSKSKLKPTRDDPPKKETPSLKRKAPHPDTNSSSANDPSLLPILDDDLNPTTSQPTTPTELSSRLQSLSTFQLSLLTHALSFPSARKITYSTCSIHVEENEAVVLRALRTQVARERGWRILRRQEQVRGLREWDVRGDLEAVREFEREREKKKDGGDGDVDVEEVAEACIRANKADATRGTMGFFVAGFVREESGEVVREREARVEASILRDEEGRIVRDWLGVPVRNGGGGHGDEEVEQQDEDEKEEEEEWNGFDDDEDDDDDGEVEERHKETAPKRRKR